MCACVFVCIFANECVCVTSPPIAAPRPSTLLFFPIPLVVLAAEHSNLRALTVCHRLNVKGSRKLRSDAYSAVRTQTHLITAVRPRRRKAPGQSNLKEAVENYY